MELKVWGKLVEILWVFLMASVNQHKPNKELCFMTTWVFLSPPRRPCFRFNLSVCFKDLGKPLDQVSLNLLVGCSVDQRTH